MGPDKSDASTVPHPQQLVERAKDMTPRLAERAARAARERRVPEETIAEMHEAGLFRVLQPKRWGGYEMDPSVFLDIELQLAQGCMSTAWIFGVQAAQPFMLALFDDHAARDVWQEDSSTLACSTLQPSPQVKIVDGGYRISGRWSYLSGCLHSRWVGVGGILPPDAPVPGERRLFLLPVQECEIVDVWFVAGLKATGSNDVVAKDVFVPEYRTLTYAHALNGTGPGAGINTAPLYKIPMAQIFFHGVTNAVIGALRGMFDDFMRHGTTRVAANGARTAEDPVAQLLCADTAATLDEIELVVHRNFRDLMARAEHGVTSTHMERLQYKYQAALSVERCSLLAARIYKAAGSSAIFDSQPFARMYADICAARQHIAGQYEAAGRSWGAPMLGAQPKPEMML